MGNPLLRELSKIPSSKDALAVLEAFEKKRREDYFVKYWGPTEHQKQVFSEFTSEVKTFVVRGGNRSGKTELGAAMTMAWALGKEYFKGESAWEWVKDLPIPTPPNNIWIVGLDFPMVRDVLWGEKLRRGRNHPPMLPKDPEVVVKVSDSEYQVVFFNGSMITCKSADSGREKFQGASVDFIWIDEEPDVDIYNECYQRTVDCAGKLLVTLTPLTDMSSGVKVPWVYELSEGVKSGAIKNVKFFSLSVMDNPFVPEEEKVELQTKWANHPEERARLYGEFIQRSGLVYPMWNSKVHIVNSFRSPRSWFRVACIDPAPVGTTAALGVVIEPGSNDYYFEREYYKADQTVSDHAKDILMAFRGEPVDVWLIDPKAGAQKQAESHKTIQQLYRDNGIPVRLAELDEDYGRSAMGEYLSASLSANSRGPKAFVMQHLANFREEIARYVWAFYGKGELKGLSKEKPVKRRDHLMNCAQYLCAMKFKSRIRASVLSQQEVAQTARFNSYT
jgi:phage terminase large subunit-like protein